jgi:hypothetical protein
VSIIAVTDRHDIMANMYIFVRRVCKKSPALSKKAGHHLWHKSLFAQTLFNRPYGDLRAGIETQF